MQVGGTIRYSIRITNRRSEFDSNVKLRVTFPEGTQYEGIVGPRNIALIGEQGRTADFTTIKELRPGDVVDFTLSLKATQAGVVRLRAEVTSEKTLTPITAEAETTINR